MIWIEDLKNLFSIYFIFFQWETSEEDVVYKKIACNRYDNSIWIILKSMQAATSYI